MINTSRGINGLVFDIDNLPGSPTAADSVFQMSPTGAFDLGANPVGSWTGAPVPSSVSVTPGSPDRVSLVWPDNAIANRWLKITVLANANTGLAEPEVYYIGHLLGETTGASGSDISAIRANVGIQLTIITIPAAGMRADRRYEAIPAVLHHCIRVGPCGESWVGIQQ